MTEFQSHEPEFDYLKSLEIEEKINKVRWCRSSNNTRMLLSTNDKTVKLWKVGRTRMHAAQAAAGGRAWPCKQGSQGCIAWLCCQLNFPPPLLLGLATAHSSHAPKRASTLSTPHAPM